MSILASIHTIDDSLSRVSLEKLVELQDRVMEDRAIMNVVHIQAKDLIDRKVEARSKPSTFQALG